MCVCACVYVMSLMQYTHKNLSVPVLEQPVVIIVVVAIASNQ